MSASGAEAEVSQSQLLQMGRDKLAAFRQQKAAQKAAEAHALQQVDIRMGGAAAQMTQTQTQSLGDQSSQSAFTNGHAQHAQQQQEQQYQQQPQQQMDPHAQQTAQVQSQSEAQGQATQQQQQQPQPAEINVTPADVEALQQQYAAYWSQYGSDPQYVGYFQQLQAQIANAQQWLQYAQQQRQQQQPQQFDQQQQQFDQSQQAQQQPHAAQDPSSNNAAVTAPAAAAVDYSASATVQSLSDEQRASFLGFAQYFHVPEYASYYASMAAQPEYQSYFQTMQQVQLELAALQANGAPMATAIAAEPAVADGVDGSQQQPQFQSQPAEQQQPQFDQVPLEGQQQPEQQQQQIEEVQPGQFAESALVQEQPPQPQPEQAIDSAQLAESQVPEQLQQPEPAEAEAEVEAQEEEAEAEVEASVSAADGSAPEAAFPSSDAAAEGGADADSVIEANEAEERESASMPEAAVEAEEEPLTQPRTESQPLLNGDGPEHASQAESAISEEAQPDSQAEPQPESKSESGSHRNIVEHEEQPHEEQEHAQQHDPPVSTQGDLHFFAHTPHASDAVLDAAFPVEQIDDSALSSSLPSSLYDSSSSSSSSAAVAPPDEPSLSADKNVPVAAESAHFNNLDHSATESSHFDSHSLAPPPSQPELLRSASPSTAELPSTVSLDLASEASSTAPSERSASPVLLRGESQDSRNSHSRQVSHSSDAASVEQQLALQDMPPVDTFASTPAGLYTLHTQELHQQQQGLESMGQPLEQLSLQTAGEQQLFDGAHQHQQQQPHSFDMSDQTAQSNTFAEPSFASYYQQEQQPQSQPHSQQEAVSEPQQQGQYAHQQHANQQQYVEPTQQPQQQQQQQQQYAPSAQTAEQPHAWMPAEQQQQQQQQQHLYQQQSQAHPPQHHPRSQSQQHIGALMSSSDSSVMAEQGAPDGSDSLRDHLQVQNLSKTIASLSREVDSLRGENARLFQQQSLLRKDVGDRNARMEMVQHDNVALLLEMEQMETEVASLQQALQTATARAARHPALHAPSGAVAPASASCDHGVVFAELHELQLQMAGVWQKSVDLTQSIDDAVHALHHRCAVALQQGADPKQLLRLTNGLHAQLPAGISATPAGTSSSSSLDAQVESVLGRKNARERSESDPGENLSPPPVFPALEGAGDGAADADADVAGEQALALQDESVAPSTPPRRSSLTTHNGPQAAAFVPTLSAVVEAVASLHELVRSKTRVEAQLFSLLRRVHELCEPMSTLLGSGGGGDATGVQKALKALQKKTIAHAHAQKPGGAVPQRGDDTLLHQQVAELRASRDALAAQLAAQVERSHLLIKDKILLAKKIEDTYEERQLVVENLREQIAQLQDLQHGDAAPHQQQRQGDSAAATATASAAPVTPEERYHQRYDSALSASPETVPSGAAASSAAAGSESSPSAAETDASLRDLNAFYVASTRPQPLVLPASPQQDAASAAAAAAALSASRSARANSRADGRSPSSPDSDGSAAVDADAEAEERRGILSSLISFFRSRFSQRGYEEALKRRRAQQRREQSQLQTVQVVAI